MSGVGEILIGPVRVLYAPMGTTLPSKHTVGYGASWGETWKELGFTKAPLTCAYEAEELDVIIEQALPAVDRVTTKEAATLETMLAEFTGANLSLLTEGAMASGAAGAAVVGFEEVVIGGLGRKAKYLWGFEGMHVTSDGTKLPVRVFVLKGTAKLNGALEFGKGDYVGVPLQVKGLADLDQLAGAQLLRIQKVTAPLTG